jgi:hypothetical protein
MVVFALSGTVYQAVESCLPTTFFIVNLEPGSCPHSHDQTACTPIHFHASSVQHSVSLSRSFSNWKIWSHESSPDMSVKNANPLFGFRMCCRSSISPFWQSVQRRCPKARRGAYANSWVYTHTHTRACVCVPWFRGDIFVQGWGFEFQSSPVER